MRTSISRCILTPCGTLSPRHPYQAVADVRTVQELLGHASVTTTQIYTHISPENLIETYLMSHPRADDGVAAVLNGDNGLAWITVKIDTRMLVR